MGEPTPEAPAYPQTIDEFLDYVARNSKAGDWQLVWTGMSTQIRAVRSDSQPCPACPICWVGTKFGVNERGHVTVFMPVATRLGLSDMDALRLAHAADDFQEPELRVRLLAACHLTAA